MELGGSLQCRPVAITTRDSSAKPRTYTNPGGRKVRNPLRQRNQSLLNNSIRHPNPFFSSSLSLSIYITHARTHIVPCISKAVACRVRGAVGRRVVFARDSIPVEIVSESNDKGAVVSLRSDAHLAGDFKLNLCGERSCLSASPVSLPKAISSFFVHEGKPNKYVPRRVQRHICKARPDSNKTSTHTQKPRRQATLPLREMTEGLAGIRPERPQPAEQQCCKSGQAQLDSLRRLSGVTGWSMCKACN